MNPLIRIIQGDALEQLKELPDGSVQCCVTSPPYWGLRDYGVAGQLGLEKTPEEYISKMVAVFREVRRVLRGDGTCWVNLGSSYASSTLSGILSRQQANVPAYDSDDRGQSGYLDSDCAYSGPCGESQGETSTHHAGIARSDQCAEPDALRPCKKDHDTSQMGCVSSSLDASPLSAPASNMPSSLPNALGASDREAKASACLPESLPSYPGVTVCADNSCLNYSMFSQYVKPKDMVPIPWMVAMALQKDGWYLRQEIIWSKANPMPESVRDRCTKAHEQVFLLSKSARYYFDQEAIKETVSGTAHKRQPSNGKPASMAFKMEAAGKGNRNNSSFQSYMQDLNPELGRNRRSVWTIPTEPYPGSHFATFPTALVQPCILAGTSARGCCPKCGAPWERVVVRNFKATSALRNNGSKGMDSSNSWGDFPRGSTESTTTGWRPTCKCFDIDLFPESARPIPCTVLDPFGGSGTVGQVALELGRSAVLIELNPKYIELARRRCDVTPGLILV